VGGGSVEVNATVVGATVVSGGAVVGGWVGGAVVGGGGTTVMVGGGLVLVVVSGGLVLVVVSGTVVDVAGAIEVLGGCVGTATLLLDESSRRARKPTKPMIQSASTPPATIRA